MNLEGSLYGTFNVLLRNLLVEAEENQELS